MQIPTCKQLKITHIKSKKKKKKKNEEAAIQHFLLEDLPKKSVSDTLTNFKYSTSNFFLPHIKKTVQIHFMMVKTHELNLSVETTVLANLSGNWGLSEEMCQLCNSHLS